MNEKELLEKIRKSADDVKVPESILPDNISGKMSKKPAGVKINSVFKYASIAAVFVIVIAVVFFVNNILKNNSDNSKENKYAVSDDNSNQTYAIKDNGKQLYTAAGDYKDIYNAIDKAYEKYETDIAYDVKGVMEDTVSGVEEGSRDNVQLSSTNKYSTTNVLTQGVDEGDIVKTDGSYIYTVVNSDRIVITDIRNDDMKNISEISLEEKNNCVYNVKEIFVDNDKLNIISEVRKRDLNEEYEDYYYLGYEDCTTYMWTYDITNRDNPKLTGEISQDGYYYTARKVNDIICLYTTDEVERPDDDSDKSVKNVLPEINGEKILSDEVYIYEKGTSELIVSSVSNDEPDKIIDKIMILNNGQIYMGNKYMYIYEYDNSTLIARFSMDDGQFSQCNYANIDGYISNDFAINEYDGRLRVVTQCENGSCVSLFDDSLKRTGYVGNIAAGEYIQSARFMGNILYLVTFRNTDPLFIFDLSEDSPKQLGELEITGFSSYLHYWKDDMLIGLGEEIEPDKDDEFSSEYKGVKLCMFDVSDKSDIKVKQTLMVSDENTYVVSDYKMILADSEANLFGFVTGICSYGKSKYKLYSWENGEFKQLMDESLYYDDVVNGTVRGLYVNNRFYIVTSREIKQYDRDDNYKLLNQIFLK